MNTDFSDKILVFSDGACSGNPGPGGYGGIVAFPGGQVEELGGGDFSTTNNRMEMMGVIQGLKRVIGRTEPVWVLTDSTYVIRGITQWIWGWKKRGWKTAENKEVVNQDLWQDLEKAVLQVKKHTTIDWKYLRGHSGTPGNERCDEIAVSFTQKKYVQFYSGPLLQYSVAIYDLPEDMALPPMREKTEKKQAHSYLSYVDGRLKRHDSWKSCEAEVKGRSGAKFKKAMSPDDEVDIVQSWGLDPSKLD